MIASRLSRVTFCPRSKCAGILPSSSVAFWVALMAFSKTEKMQSANVPEADTQWYPVEVGEDAGRLDAMARRLELLYPGRYEARVFSEPTEASKLTLKVRHMR